MGNILPLKNTKEILDLSKNIKAPYLQRGAFLFYHQSANESGK